MGGDDSQKLMLWRGAYSSPGRSKPQHQDIMLKATPTQLLNGYPGTGTFASGTGRPPLVS